jgi:pimeloyl-ACP methyl ester carboxylesterase
MAERLIDTPDGRRLRVREDGDPRGRPVLVHHGTPSAGLLYPAHVEDAAAKGIRLVAYARPGYDDSTPHPGRRVADGAADAAAVADALGFDRFATWGISGGGPHVLACAALLPERVVAAAALASVAPYGADGLDWSAGMGEDNVAEFKAARAGIRPLTEFLESVAPQLLAAEPEHILDALASLVSEVDRAFLTGEYAAFIRDSLHAGLARGIPGWRDDDLAFVEPWGFEFEQIRVPVLLRQGAQDLMVPFAHGEWLAGRIPDVEAQLSESDGHLTLEAAVPDVHAWLLERF